MKSPVKILSLITLILLGCQHQNLIITIMTYNIRYDNPNDGINRWDYRKEALCRQILQQQPDFLGTQEGLAHQIAFLAQCLTPYQKIGVGRDDGKAKGEFCAIFYNAQKYSVIKENTFWLSETPEKVSVGWDAALERICTYGIFENIKNQKQILIMNAHFDHLGTTCRAESVKLIKQKIVEITDPKMPVIFMGDLNVLPDDAPVKMLSDFLKDANKEAGIIRGKKGTFNAFQPDYKQEKRIDYIFSNDKLKAKSYRVLGDLYDGKYISDHFPVVVEYNFSH